METVFVLMGQWPNQQPRIVGVFKTLAVLQEEMESNKTSDTPFPSMWFHEFGLKD